MSSWEEYISNKTKKKKSVVRKETDTTSKSNDSFRNSDSNSSWTKYTNMKSISSSAGKEDIAPITVKNVKKDNDTWFQSSKAFDDGYDFGDITKTILGTAGDVGLNVVKGVANIGEGIGDLATYGVAGISELFGNNDYAEKLRTNAQKNLMEELFKPAEKVVEKASVIGEKGDSVAQGLGYVGSIMATGGLGSAAGLGTLGTTALTTGLTGFSSMGSGMSEAYQGGSTDEEALKYGIISGVAEAGSELIFGGLGKAVNAVGLSKGLSSLDDALAKKISSKLTSTLGKNIAEYTVKAGAEGVEEVVSGIAQGIGKKMTYMSDEELVDILKDEKLLDQFIVGAVTSGIAQAPGLVKTTNAGRDFISGYTQNEQKVIDAEVESRVNEQQKAGKELTNKEISNIRKQVEQDFEKGYVSTDTIENTLGKKLTAEQEADIEAQLNTLLQQSKTATDPKQTAQIQQQMDMLENQLNTSRSLDFSNDAYIQKSYQEKELRKEHYTYETTDNEKINKLNESASKYMNNTTRTHEMVNTVAKLIKDTDKQYEFINTEGIKELGYNIEGKKVNGLVTKDNKILINIDNDTKLLETVIGHETTHLLEGTAEYQALQDTAIEYAKTKGIYNDRIQALEGLYKGTKADIKAELTSDLTGELLFTDQSFIDSLSTEQPNVFQKIYNYIKHIYKMATAGSKEARQLEELKYRFDQAYKKAGQQAGTDTKYSISEVESMTEEDAITSMKTLFNTEKSRELTRDEKQLRQEIINKYVLSDKFSEYLREVLNEKHSNISENEVEEAQNIITIKKYKTKQSDIQGLENYRQEDIEEAIYTDVENKLIENGYDDSDIMVDSLYFHGSRKRGTARGDSDLDVVLFYQGNADDVDLFNVLNDRRINIDGIEIDINPINLNEENKADYIAKSKAYDEEILSKNKNKYSLTDNQGRTLTKEQQEYFKDSKVRDENGNLLEVYHGSQSSGFNIFKYDPMNQTGDDYGQAYYFTSDYTKAEGYTYDVDKDPRVKQFEEESKVLLDKFLETRSEEDRQALMNHRYEGKTLIELMDDESYLTEGGEVKKAYLNLKNPLEVDAKGEYYYKVYPEYFKQARKNGNDGIIVKNVIDNPRGEHRPIDVYIAFENNQIKNPDNKKPTSNPDIRYSLSEDSDIDAKINSSMTMEDAKDMIQRAFLLNNIYEWTEGKYKNGDEWLSGEGVDEVAMYIENTYQLQEKYLNKIYDKDIGFGDDFLLESVVEAYQNGTLTGSKKQTVQRLDVSKEIDYQDNRFYAPQEIKAGKKLYEKANQRVTNANRQEVYKARANFIIAAHNKGFAEAMGLTQEEVSKKLKSWANYTKKAMDLSNSLNDGVASQNRWSGIENSSIVNTISISNEEMGKMVKEIKGDSSGWQRHYITSTMLALDTHIDYSNLTFEFEAGQKMSKNAAGQYFQDEETIRISHAGQNTVAHEIGHYLDHKWAEDLGFAGKSLTDKYLKTDHLNAEQKQFVENFKLFVEDIENSSYLGSEYGRNNDYWQRSNEVFARFVGKFTEWVKNQATNNRYGYEDKWYKDNFTERQYREFVKILQEKSMLDVTDKQFKDDLRATINAMKGNYSLSAENEIAPLGQRGTYGKDVRLEIEEVIAPLQETISNLTEQVQTLQENIIPTAEQYKEVQPTQPTLEEVQNLIDIRDNKSGSEYARAFFALRDKYGQAELYKSLNEYYSTGTVTQPSNVGDIDTAPVRQDIVEKQGQEAFNTITDNDAPSFEDIAAEAMWNETYESEPDSKVESPLDNRDIDEVGNRKVKAYQYENPDVKPFFQAEAQNMLYDLDNTIKGERIATQDEEGYITGWAGITRQTTEAIAYLKDNYGYSYDQIRQGLNKIIEDDGKENNAVSKRIEFMLDERLREGYTTSDGIPIPANKDYVNFLWEKQVTEYNKEAFNAITDEDIPMYEKIEPRESSVSQKTTQGNESIPMKRITAQNQNTEATEGKQRKWVKTSTESEVVNREILPDDLDQDKIMYQPITNKATLNTANVKLDSLGYEKAVEYFNNQILNKKTTVEDIALGERLIQEAIKNKDTKTAGELIQNVAILGTELGQKVQALSIIQRMTPEGQLKMLEKTINRNKVKGDKAFNDVKLTDDMRKKILDTYNKDGSYNQEELNKAVDEVKQEIADQMPSTLLDKINDWRYFSMLGNPKTHIRNIVSNIAMQGTMKVKNAVARTIESIAPIENRTKTWKPASQDVKEFADKTTLEMKDVISSGSKYSETADIKAKRKTFNSSFMNWITNGNSNVLEAEDWWFSKSAFNNSFKEFLTANGIETKQDIQNNPELIEKGKQYATEQAQIATFRQYSWLANKIRDIESKNAATSIAVGAVLPFKKTPINIAKAGLSYSPLGFTKTLTYDIAQVKKGNMEASTLIDHLAQNTTGTALTLVGYMLAQAGFINGAGDDDKEGKYDYQLGKQAYSINIGGNTYSLSWLSPVAMPLFVGANAYEQLVEGEEWNPDVVLETLGQTLDPLSEMSFLSSLDSVLSSYDSGVQRFFGIGEAMLQNYATQFVPTVSSQLAATLDDTKRSTKVAGDSNMKVLEETYNKLIYKIPGLRQTLEPSTDIWGNEVKQSEDLLQRAFENFISPYSRKENIATEIDAELKDLYSQTGDTGILPSIPSNYVNYDGEKYNMSAKEYTDYKKTYGQTANDLLEDLFRTTTYKNATSEDRTDMVNDVYDYARDLAKQEYLNKEGVEYTNATEKGEEVYKENLIKGAIENDMTTEEYGLYVDDPEEYKFLMEKDYEYRRKYFDTSDSLKEIDNSFSEQKEQTDDDDELDALYSDKKASIIDKIINSGLDDTEKASLYKKYYNSDTVDTVMKSEINLDDYLTYETKEFKADKNEKGNSIPGSRKDKVIAYVNSLDMSIAQKAILIKSTNTFKFNDYNDTIVRYVDGLDIDYEDKVKILKDLDFEVDKEGNIFWED